MSGGGGRHVVFELLVLAERELLHFREVTPALVGRHHRAYLLKMPEHAGLTLGTERGDFAKLQLHLGGNSIAGGKQTFQFTIFGGDPFAEITAFGQIAIVKLTDALEIGILQGKLLPQPGKLVGGRGELVDAQTPGDRAGNRHDPDAKDNEQPEGKQRAAHGFSGR
jgi:hypothetical protein